MSKRILSFLVSAMMACSVASPGLQVFAQESSFGAAVAASSVTAPVAAPTVQSANGEVSAHFWLDQNGAPTYDVVYRGKQVVENSKLGMQFDFGTYDSGFTLLGTEVESQDQPWVDSFGERKKVPNKYNQIRLKYQAEDGTRIDVICRAYDEGVAFQYSFPQNSERPTFKINQELTYFNLDNSATVYAHINGNQTEVKKLAADKMDSLGKDFFRPITIVGDGYAMSITEANQVDYTRVHFHPSKTEPGTLRSIFDGKTTNSDLLPENRVHDVSVDVSESSFETSWRTFILGENEGNLLEHNYLVKNLNPQSVLKDTSWIQPGTVLRSNLTIKDAKTAIDFAVKHNVPYVHFDAGWYGPENNMDSDPWNYKDGFNLEEISAYADENDIKLMVYVNFRHLEDQYNKGQLDALFKRYVNDWGIDGIKFGFVPIGSQATTKMVYDWVKIAADNKMIVDIHDEMLPTGYERTYPNLLTLEAIHGDEENPLPNEDLGYLFTRMMAGQADHTWCYNSNRNTTKAFRFAGSIVFFSPLIFPYWYDAGSLNTMDTKPLTLWENMPTTWDETRVLEASIEKYATLARRSEDSWYVGSLSAVDRDLNLSLNFLEPGRKYKFEAFTNDPDDEKKIAMFTYIVDADTIIKNQMHYNFGYSMMINPATAEDIATYENYHTSFSAAEKLIQKIDQLGEINSSNVDIKKPLVEQIRAQYDALDMAQKLYITNYATFLEKEKIVTQIYNHPISGIKISGQELAGFDPDKLDYTVTLKPGADVPEISGILCEGSRVVRVAQVKALPGFANITVRNNYTEKTYTIYFNIPKESQTIYAADFPDPVLGGRKEYKKNTDRNGGKLSVYNANGEIQTFEKGIGSHANTDITYHIENIGITSFESIVGINPNNGNETNKVKFEVYVDGVLKYTSGNMTQKTPYKKISLNVTDAKTVKLVANDGGDGINFDHANWCDAKFNIGDTAVYAADMPDPVLGGRKEYRKNTDRSGGKLALYDQDGIVQNFEKGIGSHAITEITYDVADTGYTNFKSTIGVSANNGKETNKVEFLVYADGELKYSSGPMQQKTPYKEINVEIAGAKTVKLVANDGGDGIDYDHANWCAARFITSAVSTKPLEHMLDSAAALQGRLVSEGYKTRLQEAVDSANEVLNMAPSKLTYEIVYSASIALRDVVDEIEAAVALYSTEVLEYVVHKAIALKEGGALEHVVESVTSRFEAALANAQAVLEDAQSQTPTVSQDQVDSAWKELLNIMQYLEFKGDKTDLNKVIVIAEKISQNLDQYLSIGKEDFIKALDASRAVVADGDALNDEISASWKALLSAISALRLRPSKDALNALIAQAKTYDFALMTEQSAQQLKAALSMAEAASANPDASKDDVDEAENALTLALASIEWKAPAGGGSNGASVVETGTNTAGTAKNVKTGDPANSLAALLGLSAASGLAVFGLKRKKKTQEK